MQLRSQGLAPAPVPACVDCLFVNFFSSDSDNLTGAVLDALVEARVLENDSSSYVAASSGKFVKTRKRRGQDKPVGILIRIVPAQIEYFEMDAISAIASEIRMS
ncbi:hypothetical protein F7734_44135 [Scytonema sp. UIC 10036]|uniref:hypothetical protein n=1 Tax=Scytonema sp. UIC 10036 TaxID=2304196 RepID=UPI0012DAD51F|nr:hypothetical protein [Scytonema sp. UIC 10036]MUG98916.1 hypothetical protein [Scytonema sp. UIC 10036]